MNFNFVSVDIFVLVTFTLLGVLVQQSYAVPPLKNGQKWVASPNCPKGGTYNTNTIWCHCWGKQGYICGPDNRKPSPNRPNNNKPRPNNNNGGVKPGPNNNNVGVGGGNKGCPPTATICIINNNSNTNTNSNANQNLNENQNKNGS